MAQGGVVDLSRVDDNDDESWMLCLLDSPRAPPVSQGDVVVVVDDDDDDVVAVEGEPAVVPAPPVVEDAAEGEAVEDAQAVAPAQAPAGLSSAHKNHHHHLESSVHTRTGLERVGVIKHPPSIHPSTLMAKQAGHDCSDQASIAEDLQARSQITTAATSAVTLLSCEHSRHRRAERLIAKRDLQAALKYGECKMSINQRGQVTWKYTFADVVFIVDPTKKREITCWATPGAGLDVEKRRITPQISHAHQTALGRLKNACSWTSHTVVIVDQSGSMRKTDVTGGSTRSDAVWLTLACDFIAKNIENGTSTDSDIVSVVSMGTVSTVLIDRQPHDWMLFNAVIDLLRSQEPKFDGNYVPALDAAESLLLKNASGACALTLFFLSDGKPSDHLPQGTKTHLGTGGIMTGLRNFMCGRIESLASRFGRRLSVTTVGFAGLGEDFRVLEGLAERSTHFGSVGRFFTAQLNPEALGTAFSSIASSLNSTRTELSVLGGSSQRIVRDVRRQACHTVGQDKRPDANWYLYMKGTCEWDGHRQTWVPTGNNKGWSPSKPLHLDACGVALKETFFGEGAERLVREFREIGSDGRFVGPLLVAKESRFQEDVANTDPRRIKAFHRTFCDTQARASGLARVFNERLEKLPGYDPWTTPLVTFLDCSVYMVDDINLGTLGCLVEKQLDPTKYKKWNDNKGGVNGQEPVAVGTLEPLDVAGGLGVIEEFDDQDVDEDIEDSDEDEATVHEDSYRIRVEDIPQAFSHFTYRYTKRRLLVCDLQGVLSTPLNSKYGERHSPYFEFTDPVIHFSSRCGRRNCFGRTDRGLRGIHDFFKSHECSPLCRALNRKWLRRVGQQQRSETLDGLEDSVSNLVL